MTPPALYLDANATEPLRPEARLAALEAMDLTGNPSSVHAEGRAARRLLEKARTQVAVRFGARARDVVFTSGALEDFIASATLSLPTSSFAQAKAAAAAEEESK